MARNYYTASYVTNYAVFLMFIFLESYNAFCYNKNIIF